MKQIFIFFSIAYMMIVMVSVGLSQEPRQTLTPKSVISSPLPIVGLWEDVIVIDDKTLDIKSRQQFIFTNKPLKRPTNFTALKDFNGEVDMYCCLEVHSTEPLHVEDIKKLYHHDHDFIHRLDGIHGLPYIYRGEFSRKKKWNDNMRRLKGDANDVNDIPFSTPVIEGYLHRLSVSGNHFKNAHGQRILFWTHIPQDKEKLLFTHHFLINGQKIRFTSPPRPLY